MQLFLCVSRGDRTLITHDRLCEVLDYDPLTGVFRWRVSTSRRVHVGDVAGTKMPGKRGRIYYRVKIDGEFYYLHNLAWFYVNGVWPTKIIDHIDGDSNAIDNLREATYAQNAFNKNTPKTKKHGFKGVSSSRHQFCARIWLNNTNKIIGYYATPREAAEAYDAEALKHFGEFAMTNTKLGLL